MLVYVGNFIISLGGLVLGLVRLGCLGISMRRCGLVRFVGFSVVGVCRLVVVYRVVVGIFCFRINV